MTRTEKSAFKPNYALPPGETLKETIESIGMTQAELAQRTGRPKKTINEIIKGKAAITPDTAIQLERVLGVPASFWNNLERNYQEKLKLLKAGLMNDLLTGRVGVKATEEKAAC